MASEAPTMHPERKLNEDTSGLYGTSVAPKHLNLEYEHRYVGKNVLEFEKEYAHKMKYDERIMIGSPEFNDYVAMLVENGEKNLKRTHICLSCW